MNRRRVLTEVIAAIDSNRIVSVGHALVVRHIAQARVSDIGLLFNLPSERQVARVNARVPERKAGQPERAAVVRHAVVGAVVGHKVDLVRADVRAVAAGEHGNGDYSLVFALAVAEGPQRAAACGEDCGCRGTLVEFFVRGQCAGALGTWCRDLDFRIVGADELVADSGACVGARLATTERDGDGGAPIYSISARSGGSWADLATACTQLWHLGDVADAGYRGV